MSNQFYPTSLLGDAAFLALTALCVRIFPKFLGFNDKPDSIFRWNRLFLKLWLGLGLSPGIKELGQYKDHSGHGHGSGPPGFSYMVLVQI